MPLVDFYTLNKVDTSGIDVELFYLEVEMEADLDVSFDLFGNFLLGINITTAIFDSEFGETNFELGIDYDSTTFLRVDADDPNVELEAEFEIGMAFEDFVVAQTVELQGLFNLGLTNFSEDPIDQELLGSSFFTTELSEFLLTVDVTEIPIFSANYQEYKARLLVDGGGIPIESYTITAAPNKIGLDVSVTLARPEDRALLINSSSSYVFELGVVDHAADDAIRWETMCTGQALGDSYSLGWEGNGPTDLVQLSTADVLSNRLNIAPLLTVVFFDRSVLDLDAGDFEPIYSISGAAVPVLLYGISGLTLYSILDFAFGQINLGLSTNIPNFRVTRLDIEIGQSYFQSVSSLFGVFEPILVERDGVVHILDSTQLSISGFPTTRTLTPTDYRTVSATRSFSDIWGYAIRYTQNQAAWDYHDEDTDEVVNIVEDADEGSVTEFILRTTTRYFRKRAFPSAVVRSETIRIESETWTTTPYWGGPILVNSTDELFVYDPLGKQKRRTKTEKARVPIWYQSFAEGASVGEGYWQYDFGTVKYERDLSYYKTNPYKKGTEYRSVFDQIVRAFIYVDSEKQMEPSEVVDPLEIDPDREVPTKYKQEYVTAYRSGNLKEPEVFEPPVVEGEETPPPSIIPHSYFGTIYSRMEKTTPLSEDIAKIETKEVDYLSNVSIVNVSQDQIGEISTSSQVSSSRRAIVTGPPNPNNTRMETLNIGEIPIGIGFGLALRKLVKAADGGQISIENIGFDLGIKRGTSLSVIGREALALGTYFIEGWRIEGRKLGTKEQTVMSYYDGTKTS